MRNLITALILAAFVLGVPANVAYGEDLYPPGAALNQYARRPYGNFPYGYYPYLRGRAAWLYGAGAYLQGRGQLARDMGEAEYLDSLATINREHARRLDIENREQAAETYFNMKRLNRDARQELAAPRATAQDMARYAKDRLPDELSEQQYDRQNGRVAWPAVLLREQFEADRELIDALVTQRSTSNVVAAEIDSEIASVTEGMLQTLRMKGANLNSTDYITAMKFIKSLNYEARVNPSQSVSPNQYVAATPSLSSVVSR